MTPVTEAEVMTALRERTDPWGEKTRFAESIGLSCPAPITHTLTGIRPITKRMAEGLGFVAEITRGPGNVRKFYRVS